MQRTRGALMCAVNSPPRECDARGRAGGRSGARCTCTGSPLSRVHVQCVGRCAQGAGDAGAHGPRQGGRLVVARHPHVRHAHRRRASTRTSLAPPLPLPLPLRSSPAARPPPLPHRLIYSYSYSYRNRIATQDVTVTCALFTIRVCVLSLQPPFTGENRQKTIESVRPLTFCSPPLISAQLGSAHLLSIVGTARLLPCLVGACGASCRLASRAH